MSKGKRAALDPEQTLRTLDQLSQTIDVMSQVIVRLRRQVSRQLRHNDPCETQPESGTEAGGPGDTRRAGSRRPSLPRRQSRVLH